DRGTHPLRSLALAAAQVRLAAQHRRARGKTADASAENRSVRRRRDLVGYTAPVATHEVLNQPPPLEVNLFAADRALREAVEREGAAWATAQLLELGQLAGSRAAQVWAAQANENPPRLRTHDRYGNRVDEVEFHPAWHELMRVAVAHG